MTKSQIRVLVSVFIKLNQNYNKYWGVNAVWDTFLCQIGLKVWVVKWCWKRWNGHFWWISSRKEFVWTVVKMASDQHMLCSFHNLYFSILGGSNYTNYVVTMIYVFTNSFRSGWADFYHAKILPKLDWLAPYLTWATGWEITWKNSALLTFMIRPRDFYVVNFTAALVGWKRH